MSLTNERKADILQLLRDSKWHRAHVAEYYQICAARGFYDQQQAQEIVEYVWQARDSDQ